MMDTLAPWCLASALAATCNGQSGPGLVGLVSAVPPDLEACIEEDGLQPAPVDDLRRLLPAAQAWLGTVPGLERLVLRVTKHIHPLAAEPGYDVSHSQPRWRDRIFVSCPERGDGVGALRLVEGVIHEAMHLHLTNEEEDEPLVVSPSSTAWSPWRQVDRPAQGVLHGLFVFACIHRFLAMLPFPPAIAQDERRHVTGRLDTIQAEVEELQAGKLRDTLTDRGRIILDGCLHALRLPGHAGCS